MQLRVCPLIAAVLALCVSACSQRGAAEEKMHKIGSDKMRAEAAMLYKNVFAGAAPTFRTVNTREWPESFRAMAPLDVGAYRDGFSLTIHRKGDAESGIYVVPKYMDVSPNPGRQARFDRISDGIYWYTFGP
jgi:hypothetical protein